MYPRTLRVFFLYFIIFLLIFCSSATVGGCSRKPAKSPPKKQETEKKESEKLKKLQDDIEIILKDFEKEYLKQTAPVPQAPTQQQAAQGQQGQEEQQRAQQSDQQQGGENKGQEKKQGGNQGQSKQQQEGQDGAQDQKGGEQAQQQGPDWPKYEMSVTKLHDQWNKFEGEAIKNGATPDMLNSFNSKLNELTINLTEQDLYGGLLAANDLYVETVPFEQLFKTKAPPEIKRVLYHARDAAYRALHNEQEKAMDSISNAMRAWESVKHQVDNADRSNQVEFALRDLEEAIPQKDPNLIKIEAQIVEKNIQDIIDSME